MYGKYYMFSSSPLSCHWEFERPDHRCGEFYLVSDSLLLPFLLFGGSSLSPLKLPFTPGTVNNPEECDRRYSLSCSDLPVTTVFREADSNIMVPSKDQPDHTRPEMLVAAEDLRPLPFFSFP